MMVNRKLDAAMRARAEALSTRPSGTYRRLLVRPILEHPNPVLERRSLELDATHARAVALSEILIQTMRAHGPTCIGLSAPQIGENVRIICFNVTGHPHARSCAGLLALVNPVILARAGAVSMRESCASVPFLVGDVGRASEVVVSGFEPGSGRRLVFSADGIEARVLQHEIDHLDGWLFTDRARCRGGVLSPRTHH